ncbi:MAG: hypothetical protein JXQ69_01900 [Paludibacteraceae bacterium]|nr:hypothetical protein [Paludibacteraceae bacterium]MBN2787052.1 hypothetical protein [Paludibacteraceae bacterium]
MRKIIFIALALLSIIALTAARKPKKKNTKKAPQETTFTGIISYYGKVTRIPDKSKTTAKLNDFEAQFQLYMNEEYTRRIEKYENLGLTITLTEGINHDFYMQSVHSKDGNLLAIATLDEMKELQLTPKYVRYNSLKMRKVSGKKRVQGYICKKAISDIVTEDNIRIQLVAWYCPELTLKGYQTPYFPKLQGYIPLVYDMYTGQHVVTYSATDVKKQALHNGYFSKPDQMEPLNYKEFLKKIQEIGNKQQQEEF